MKLLTKEQLSELLQNISPHSFKHNVVALVHKEGLVAASEPVTDVNAILEVIKATHDLIESFVASLDPDLEHDASEYTKGEQLLALTATLFGSLVIAARISAFELGIPLEEVQDVLTALLLKEQDNHEEAVNTVLFGLASTEENNV